MQDILREYGPAIITFVAVIALIGLVVVLVGNDENSVVGQAFAGLIQNFFQAANPAADPNAATAAAQAAEETMNAAAGTIGN